MISVGIVVIGRNEGDRLRYCLDSAIRTTDVVVYVDSGSTDGSVRRARDMGVAIIELDMRRQFSASRARNEGFQQLMHLAPDIEFVQFVDGDCEIVEGWIETAAKELVEHPRIGIVCGRRRERHPDASVYNKLCDIEWDTPVGEVSACGGDSMIRVRAFREAGGFDATVIAGEEPELCHRLREKGWKIFRLDADMTLHDAAMTHFSQWWQRNVRAGHAFAQGSYMHGGSPQRHWVKQTISNWIWGIFLPLFIFISAPFTSGISLLLLAMYPLLAARINGRMRRRGLSKSDARSYATYIVIGKIPQAIGQLKFTFARILGRPMGIIEYKSLAPRRAAHI